MELKESVTQPFRFESPQQEHLYRRLALIGPGAAAFYRDACQLITEGARLDSTAHLVGHLAREIESAVRAVLLPRDFSRAEECAQCKNRPEEHKKQIGAVLAEYDFDEAHPVAQLWRRLADRGDDFALAGMAHRQSLGPPRGRDDLHVFWREFEGMLDAVLDRFESHYMGAMEVLDQLLAKPMPSAADARRLRNNIPNNPATLAYFFERACPAWLNPLRGAGFFNPILWPASRYLARMAMGSDSQQQAVRDVILEAPASDDFQVHADLVDAAVAMPSSMAAKVATREAEWIDAQDQLFGLLPDKLADLAGQLARGGEQAAAAKLLGALLVVLPDSEGSRHSPDPRGKMDDWDYEQILGKSVPDLLSAAPEPAIALLCDLLEVATKLSVSAGGGETDAATDSTARWCEDSSSTWRRAVEDSGQDLSPTSIQGVRGLLVSALRDSAERCVRDRWLSVAQVVDLLERRRWLIFERVALHLLRVFPDKAPSYVAERLTDRSRIARSPDFVLVHEFALLLRERFKYLPREERDRIIAWIAAGPEPEWAEELHRQHYREPAPSEYVERYRKGWQLYRLALIRDDLSGCGRAHYDALVKELGEPEHPEFASYSSGEMVGPTSPRSAAELGSMSVEDIVALLAKFQRDWKPGGSIDDPFPEGLGRELMRAVSADPERFASDSLRFRTLHPTYVRSFLFGLDEATRQKRDFSWPPVLELCGWVLQQPREALSDREPFHYDIGWGRTRHVIAGLLSEGFGQSAIPFGLRTIGWDVLKPLTDDDDPTPELEARYADQNMDPANLSISTTRGEAMHAVVRYALWVRQHVKEQADGEQRLERGFGEIPEVREVLEARLDNDPSVTVRSVYGQWFPQLVLLDHNWAASAAQRIFPTDESIRSYRDAAWNTYVKFCDPYDSTFTVLREQYRAAVDRIGTAGLEHQRTGNVEELLASHLMTLYWRGKIEFDDPDGLLTRFYAKASDALLGAAVRFIGRSLSLEQEGVPAEFLVRLRALWERRIQLARTGASPGSHTAELTAFGWWFSSGKFDDEWALIQIIASLKLVPKTEPDHRVVERLAKLAHGMPSMTAECLRLLVDGDIDGWCIYRWREQAKTILKAAMGSGDIVAEQAARELTNRIVARGLFEFGELLEQGEGDPSLLS